jgi:uncharacterized membrane protein SpoIIM required for sporulation
MNQHTFESQNRPRWEEIDRLTQRLEKNRTLEEAAVLPSLYRQLCADIALTQHRMYGMRLSTELNERLIRVRQVLENPDERGGRGFARLILQDFPRAVRREWRLFWLGMALFFVPMILMVVAAYVEPRWIFSVLGPEELRQLDSSFGKGGGLEGLRGRFDSDFAMFGHYVQNNISIGLNTAGAGLLAMVGALFMLAFNGIVIGASEGYIHYAGDLEKFYSFVAGHSAFELTGIVICGVAGMRLGQAVLKPGSLTRGAAIAEAGRRALPLIYGGALLIFFAAFIEGFWSAGPAAPQVKYAVGLTLAAGEAFYLIFCGRKGQHEA